MNQICEQCRYWQQWDYQPDARVTVGDCRKNAPGNYPVGTKFLTRWPSTKAIDFCGEFKPRRETE